MSTCIAQPSGETIANCIHDAGDTHHGTSSLSCRNFSLIHGHDDSQDAGANACYGPTNAKHGDRNGTSIERTANDQDGASELYSSLAAKFVCRPSAYDASKEGLLR